jgi:hypothetical protein
MKETFYTALTLGTIILLGLGLLGVGALIRNEAIPQSSKEGDLPNDICVVDGKPLILSALPDSSDGQPSITYIRDNGDLVIRLYGFDESLDGVSHRERYWTGGVCPSGES